MYVLGFPQRFRTSNAISKFNYSLRSLQNHTSPLYTSIQQLHIPVRNIQNKLRSVQANYRQLNVKTFTIFKVS